MISESYDHRALLALPGEERRGGGGEMTVPASAATAHS
jgi:hypothetical protein